jgi:hypothetical protein
VQRMLDAIKQISTVSFMEYYGLKRVVQWIFHLL